MTDWSWFLADDWKITPRLTINVGVRHEYFGFPSEVNGLIAAFDYPTALATGSIQNGFIFPSNFKPGSIAGAAGGICRPPTARVSFLVITTTSCRAPASPGLRSRTVK